jgi:thymidylate kinase
MSKFSRAFAGARQVVLERLGVASHTENPLLNEKIEMLERTYEQYDTLLHQIALFRDQLVFVAKTHTSLADSLADFGVREDQGGPLSAILAGAAASHRGAARATEVLAPKLDRMCDQIRTFRNAALEDARVSLDRFDEARIAYDSARNSYESLERLGRRVDRHRLAEAEDEMKEAKVKFDAKLMDTFEKLVVLNEMRVKQTRSALEAYVKAMAAFQVPIATSFIDLDAKTTALSANEDDAHKAVSTSDFKRFVLKEEFPAASPEAEAPAAADAAAAGAADPAAPATTEPVATEGMPADQTTPPAAEPVEDEEVPKAKSE